MFAINPSPDRNDLPVLLVRQHLSFELVGRRSIVVGDAQEPVVVDLVFEFSQEPVERENDSVWAARAKEPRIEDRPRRLDRGPYHGLRKLVLAQERLQRGRALHDSFDGLAVDRENDVSTRSAGRRSFWRGAAGTKQEG